MAESEQVKAILESNMQMLRDALEKSGVDIQSLSVSVGQQYDRNDGNDRNDYRNRHVQGGLRVFYEEQLYPPICSIHTSIPDYLMICTDMRDRKLTSLRKGKEGCYGRS